MKLKVTVNGTVYDVDVEVEEAVNKPIAPIVIGGSLPYGATSTASTPAETAVGLTAPIAGTVVNILVEPGKAVTSGETLVVLEAMKMETEITAPADGVVAVVRVEVGDAVTGGQVLLEWE